VLGCLFLAFGPKAEYHCECLAYVAFMGEHKLLFERSHVVGSPDIEDFNLKVGGEGHGISCTNVTMLLAS
jgi:hypothetical protein